MFAHSAPTYVLAAAITAATAAVVTTATEDEDYKNDNPQTVISSEARHTGYLLLYYFLSSVKGYIIRF